MKQKKLLVKHFDIIFTEEDKKNNIPKVEIDTALKEGRAVDNRWHICKDGSKFYAYGLVFPLTGIDGELLGYVKILRDLNREKEIGRSYKKICKRNWKNLTLIKRVFLLYSHMI